MPALQPQVVDEQEFIDLLDYQFTGDNRTVENKRAVVSAYRDKASIYHAAQAARVARGTVYRWLEHDPAFAQAMTDSAEDSADVMETSVYERALGRNGHKPDSLLAMFWLKAKRPQFRDKVAVDMPTIQNQVKDFIRELVAQAANNQADNIGITRDQKTQLLQLSSPVSTSTSDDPNTRT